MKGSGSRLVVLTIWAECDTARGTAKGARATHRALGCARLVYASVSSSPGAMSTMHRTTMRPLPRNMYLQCRPMSY